MVRVSFTTAGGDSVDFSATGKKKRPGYKRPLNAYNKFVKKRLTALNRKYPGQSTENMRRVGREWQIEKANK